MTSSTGGPAQGDTEDTFDAGAGGLLHQPKAVWATAGASVVAFMGIGLVDPILPSIAKGLDATPSQVSLLFTSYFLITAVAMLLTGFVSSRVGGKKTLLLGLALVVVFAGLAGTSGSVGELVGFRAGFGGWATPCSSRRPSPSSSARRRAAAPRRSCCTSPRSASAWPAGRCSARCSATPAGATRSSAPRS